MPFQNVVQGVLVMLEMIMSYYNGDIVVRHTALNLSQVLP